MSTSKPPEYATNYIQLPYTGALTKPDARPWRLLSQHLVTTAVYSSGMTPITPGFSASTSETQTSHLQLVWVLTEYEGEEGLW